MRLIEWIDEEDNYQEQMYIPVEAQKIAEAEGIVIENKKQVAVRITNLTTGETFESRLKITGNRQLYLPVEIQRLLVGSGKIRIQILGG